MDNEGGGGGGTESGLVYKDNTVNYPRRYVFWAIWLTDATLLTFVSLS